MSSEDNRGDQNKDGDDGGQKVPVKGFAIWMLAIMLMLLAVQFLVANKNTAESMQWDELVAKVEAGQIQEATQVDQGHGVIYLTGRLKSIDDRTGELEKFRVDYPASDAHVEWLLENLPQAKFERANVMWKEVMVSFLPVVLLLGLLYFLFVRQMRMAGKGAMSFGKSRAKLLTRNKNKIMFKDVAGAEEAKEEVSEIIEFLRDPKKFQKLGGRIPKGVLLVGPPGTGKTLIAKAIAGEAEVPFFSISGSDFVEMFVGVGASRVRDMFEQGKKNAPCIIFIDEIDAVGRSRFSGMGGGHDEREQTLNALLVEMDGFDTQEGVIIVAATNRPDVLDNALLRPGRFDRQITVDLPHLQGRYNILKIHAKKIKLSDEVDLMRAARGTPGFSGADLANLCNEAALLAARRGAESVEMGDLEEARDKVRFGAQRRSQVMDEHESKLTAYHEAGHAIVFDVLEHAEPVHKVTIIPRGQSLGATMQLPEKDELTHSKRKLEAILIGFMGGRAAEELAMDDITTGASNDIERATNIARAMVCQFGMDDQLGMRNYGGDEDQQFMGREVGKKYSYSEKTADLIDQRVTGLLKWAYEEAMRILRENREALDTMCDVLRELETISGQDVKEIVKYNRILSAEERAELEPEAVDVFAPKKEEDEPSSPDGGGLTTPSSSVMDDGDAPFPDPSPA